MILKYKKGIFSSILSNLHIQYRSLPWLTPQNLTIKYKIILFYTDMHDPIYINHPSTHFLHIQNKQRTKCPTKIYLFFPQRLDSIFYISDCQWLSVNTLFDQCRFQRINDVASTFRKDWFLYFILAIHFCELLTFYNNAFVFILDKLIQISSNISKKCIKHNHSSILRYIRESVISET